MDKKPTLPESYILPAIWEEPTSVDGKFGSMNRATAGARSSKDVPKGEHPLQLYSLGTPNGVKVTIMLEELGVEYDAWFIDIMKLDQFTSGFTAVNPNSKIPAMLDYDASKEEEEPVRIFESGSILLYLAEKYGKFLPPKDDVRNRTEVINWLMFQMASAPFIGGGFGHFYAYAPAHIEYAINRYSMETKRLLDVLDQHLDGRDYMVGDDLTIADIALWPWVRIIVIDGYPNASTFLQVEKYHHLMTWYNLLAGRKGFQRGIKVNSSALLRERHSKDDFSPDEY
jgi:GST-like protein